MRGLSQKITTGVVYKNIHVGLRVCVVHIQQKKTLEETKGQMEHRLLRMW